MTNSALITTAGTHSTMSPPGRPRLLPGIAVLHRGAGEVQVGTDPRHALVFGGLSSRLTDLLHGLDGRRTVAELLRDAGPDEPGAVTLLGELAAAGLIERSPPPAQPVPPLARLNADATAWSLRAERSPAEITALRATALVVIRGDGRVGVSLACLLAAAGVGWVHVAADGAVTAEDVGSGYREADVGQPRGPAAERALRRISSVVRGDQPPPARRPDLVVLTDVLVPDPRLVRTLYLERSPHLLVRVREGTGLVGPLVIPDRTSCLRCGDLQERDRDGAWPAVATQLAGRCQPADLPTAQATAAFASGQVLRVLDGLRVGGTPPPVAGHILEVDVFEGSTQRIPWPAHPECGCGAARSRPPLAQ